MFFPTAGHSSNLSPPSRGRCLSCSPAWPSVPGLSSLSSNLVLLYTRDKESRHPALHAVSSGLRCPSGLPFPALHAPHLIPNCSLLRLPCLSPGCYRDSKEVSILSLQSVYMCLLSVSARLTPSSLAPFLLQSRTV